MISLAVYFAGPNSEGDPFQNVILGLEPDISDAGQNSGRGFLVREYGHQPGM